MMTEAKTKQATRMVTAGTPLTEVGEVLGVSHTTLYCHLGPCVYFVDLWHRLFVFCGRRRVDVASVCGVLFFANRWRRLGVM